MGKKEDKKRHGLLYNYDARAPTVREESQTTHHESTESLEPANAVNKAAVAENNDTATHVDDIHMVGKEGFHSKGARAPMSECGVGDLKVTKCDVVSGR